MEFSRGARRCLRFLQSLAKNSGRAFPYQKTIAEELDVDMRSVRRYIRELLKGGAIVSVKKRQRTSAEYTLRPDIQTGQNVRSNVRSSVRSKQFILYDKKMITSEKLWPKPMQTETQNHILPGKEAQIEAWLKERKVKHGW